MLERTAVDPGVAERGKGPRAPKRAVRRAGPHWLRHLGEYLKLAIGFAVLGLGCVAFSALALSLTWLLPVRSKARCGRRLATHGFRLYLFGLRLIGVARFDLTALDALRDAGPLIIAANHPGLLDALMLVSRLPNVVCVFKASLLRSVFWGAGARLADYIPNDQFLGSINRAIEELRGGSQLLLFPEGTRTDPLPLGEFRAGAAYVSYRARVRVQTVLIEQETEFLGKRAPFFYRPDMPMHFRIRLGRCFDPPDDPREFTRVLRNYFLQELA